MIVRSMPNTVYHQHPAIGSTTAKLMLKSRQLFHDAMTGVYKRKETPSLTEGRIAHTAVLEPERFKANAVTHGPINEKTGAPYGRDTQAFAKWQAENPDAMVVDEWILRSINRMPREVADILAKGEAETSVFHETRLGFGVKARPDWRNGGDLSDLKSIDDIDRAERALIQWGYWFSEGWYRMVCDAEIGRGHTFRWIFMEKKAPFRWRILVPDASYRMYADAKVEQILGDLEECYRTGDWSDKEPIEEMVSLPEFMNDTEETEDEE